MDFYKPPPGSGGHTSTATVKPPSTIAKPPPAPVYWFQGRKYTSYATYVAAVAAYNRQRASAAAYAAWLASRKTQLARQQLMARQRAQAAAALAAKRREYARRVAAQRKVMLGRKTAEAQRLLARQKDAARASLHKQRESEMAIRRREAWDQMQRRQRVVADRSFGVRSPGRGALNPMSQQRVARQGRLNAEFEARAAARRFRDPAWGQQRETQRRERMDQQRLETWRLTDDDPRKGANDRRTLGQRRRERLISEARETGDYKKPLEWLAGVVKRTGGRYYDAELFDGVFMAANEKADSITKPYTQMINRILAMRHAGNVDGAMELLNGTRFQELSKQYSELLGEGRKDGWYAELLGVSQRIGADRDKYLERVFLGEFANRDLTGADEATLRQFRERYGRGGLTGQTAVGGAKPMEGEERPVGHMSLRTWLDRQYRTRAAEVGRQAGLTFRQKLAEQGVWDDSKEANDKREAHKDYLQGLIDQPGSAPGLTMARLRELGKQASQDGSSSARNELIKLIEGLVSDTSPWVPPRGLTYVETQRAKTEHMNMVARKVRTILGWFSVEGPMLTGFGGALDRVSRAPVAGMLMGGINAGMAWLGATNRESQWEVKGIGGLERRPELRFEDWTLKIGTEDTHGQFTPGFGFLPGLMTDQSPEYRREFKTLYDRYRKLIARADREGFWAGMGTRREAWEMLQGELTTGNAGILYDTLADPLSYIGPARFINAGKMMLAEAGGVRGALASLRAPGRAGVASSLVRDYSRFVRPQLMGGISSAERTELVTLMRLGKFESKTLREIKDLSRMEQAEIAERMLKGQTAKEIAQHVSAWETIYKRDEVNAQQIMTLVQNELESELRRTGSGVPAPAEMARMLDDAVREQKKAAEELALAAKVEAERVPHAQVAQALHAVRVEREAAIPGAPAAPKAPGRVKASTGGAQRQLNILQREVMSSLEARAKVAQRAADALEVFRSPERSIDPKVRQKAFYDLRDSLDVLDRYRDLPTPTAGHGGPSIGIINRRKARLRAYRTAQDVSSGTLTFRDVDQIRLAGDARYIVKQIIAAKAALRATKNPARISQLKARLARLDAAKEGLRIETAVSKGGAGVVQRTRRSHAGIITDTFSGARVARTQLTADEGRQELGREMYARYSQRVVEVTPNFKGEVKALRRAEATLNSRALVQIPEVQDLLDISRALGVPNPTLAEMYEMTLWLRRDYVAGAGLDEAFRAVEDQVSQVLRQVQVTPINYSKWVDYGHITGKTLDLDELRRVDPLVADEVRRLTGSHRKGAYRSAKKGSKLPDDGPMVVRDDDPVVVLAKIRLLRREGYSLAAYDEARSALGEISRRDLIGKDLREKAGRLKGDHLENFLSLREAKRQVEGENDLEQFVNEHLAMNLDSELMAGGDEAMVNAWVEARTLDDLRPPRRSVTAYQEKVLRESLRGLGVDPDDTVALTKFLQGSNAPPFGLENIAELRKWLVAKGFWTPKTGEEIASGARVWSVADERLFWETMYGWTPPWTRPDVIGPLLHRPQEFMEQMKEWGFLENDFEKLSGDTDIETVRNAIDAIAFGGKGVKKARTYQEMRAWFEQRYGDMVVDEQGNFIAVPWMMNFDEYQAWFSRRVEDAGLAMRAKSVVPVGTGVPAEAYPIRSLMADLGMDATLASPEEALAVLKAIRDMVPRHLERVKFRLRKAGARDDMWLPEERMRFAYEITDALLTDKSWRAWSRRMSGTDRVLAVAGLQRLFVTMNLAFPIMNAIDSFGPKAAMVSLLANRGRWVHTPKSEWYGFFTREEIYATARHTWNTSGAWTRVGNVRYSAKAQQRAFLTGVFEVPMKISGSAENVLRYNTAVSVAGRVYDDLIKAGIDPVAARAMARAEGMSAVKSFFSTLDGAPDWLLALNQIVPFLTYNYKNSLMGLRIMYEMPWVFQIGQRLGEGIRERNRQIWADTYGSDVRFNENDPQMSQLWWTFGDTTYSIDLSMFSDWTRAMASLTDENKSFYENFVRVPHPIQTAIFGMLWEGQTSWGEKADWTQLNFWFELFDYLDDPEPFNSINPKSKDLIQWITQALFFKQFGRVDPIKARVQEFFGILAVDEQRGWDFYRDYPELQAYFQLNGVAIDPFQKRVINWFTFATEADIKAYEVALKGWGELKEMLGRQAGQFYLEPWSREARQAKLERQAMLKQYLLDHPVLADAWAFTSDANEFAELRESFKVDMEVEDYFNLKAPRRADFASDLLYAEAQADYLDAKQLFLEQHPAVVDYFSESRNAIERAWFEQETHWDDILRQQADVKIAIATEEAKADPDRDLVSFLYDLSDENYKRLDAEAFGQFYDYLNPEIMRRSQRGTALGSLSRAMGRVKQLVKFPGRSDFFYGIASDEERVQIRADEAYHSALGGMMDEFKVKGDFSQFWPELKRRGLLDRYLKENPGKRVDYNYSVAISRIFNKGGYQKFWDNLMAEPYWLSQYLSRPSEGKSIADKQATYQRVLAGKRYFNGITAVWDRLNGDFSKFYDELAKQPWLQAEYFRRHPEKAGGGGATAYGIAIQSIFAESKDGLDFMKRLGANPALQAEYFRRNPDAAARFAAGREYFNWMQRWVKALSVNDHAGATAIWDAMPEWVHERYFAKHPDKRGKVVQNSAYSSALGGWVALLKAGKNQEADAYFKALPDSIKERYYKKHPDQRAKNDLSSEMLARGAEYFLSSGDDKLKVLQRNPQFAAWLREHGGKEGEMRGLIFAIYRAIPSKDAWLKRTFRESYPEYFSKEVAGERRLAKVNRELAEHPEMEPFYEKALALQQATYTAQLRLNKAPPRPLQYERRKRLRKRQKRRAARMHSQWRHYMALR